MVSSLILLADSAVLREIHNGAVHTYRIHLESDRMTVPEEIDYVLWTRCRVPKDQGSEPTIEFRINDFRVAAGGKSHRQGRVGAGTLGMPGSGLPDALSSTLVQTDFWYPLLTWYLPPEVKGGGFTASQSLGSSAQFMGKGTLKDGEYDFTGKLADATGNGPRVTLSWKVASDGWLDSGEGTVVAPDGTVSFKISAK